MSVTTPYDTDRYPARKSRSVLSRSFLPLVLITLGVVFLLGNLIPGPGRAGLVLLGLGVAFTIGRVTTGRYGYSLPAGILIAIGSYVSLQDIVGPRSSGWFFVLLGLGFVLAYLIGMRPGNVWPLFPATVLIGLGLVLFGWASAAPIASFAWIVGYWPAVLVLLGIWLLFRDQLPDALKRPIATVGGILLLAYGLLAALASVAAAGTLARSDFMTSFGGTAPLTDTVSLDQPIASGDAFKVTNSSGRTTIRASSDQAVHVVATRHFSIQGEPPAVRLTSGSGSVNLDMHDNRPFFGPRNWVDYAIDVPANVHVNAHTSSGALEVDGVAGAVEVESSSGGVELSNIGGELKVSSSSGRVHGTQLRRVREVHTSSGSIVLDGVFSDAAQIRSSSGRVDITFAPTSAVQLDVRTGGGSIQQRGLSLANQRSEKNALSGALGAPASNATLSIQTSSGSVVLSQ